MNQELLKILARQFQEARIRGGDEDGAMRMLEDACEKAGVRVEDVVYEIEAENTLPDGWHVAFLKAPKNCPELQSYAQYHGCASSYNGMMGVDEIVGPEKAVKETVKAYKAKTDKKGHNPETEASHIEALKHAGRYQ